MQVAGLTLIERAILSAKKAGITEFVIVTGYQGAVLQRRLSPKRQNKLGVTIQFVQNDDWDKPNGHSVLAGAAAIERGGSGRVFVLDEKEGVAGPAFGQRDEELGVGWVADEQAFEEL